MKGVSRNLTILVIILSIALALNWQAEKKQPAELLRLQSEMERMRADLARLSSAEKEAASLKASNKDLTQRLPSILELAELRAKSTELAKLQKEHVRVRAELENAKAALDALAHGRTPVPAVNLADDDAPEPFTSQGMLRLKPGETAITGGWELAAGKRGFAFVLPKIQKDGNVLIESRIVSMSEATATSAGLAGLLTMDRQVNRYSAVDSDAYVGIINAIKSAGGMDVLSSPRVITSPGNEAQISTLDANQNGIILKISPRIRTGGQTVDLEMNTIISVPRN